MNLLEPIGLILFIIGMAEYAAGIAIHYKVKLKPFNCSWCLTLWFGLPVIHWYTWGIPVEVLETFYMLGYLFTIRQIVWRQLY